LQILPDFGVGSARLPKAESLPSILQATVAKTLSRTGTVPLVTDATCATRQMNQHSLMEFHWFGP